MEEETWRGREGVVGCGRYFRLRMGSLGRGGVLDQVLPPSKLENQGQGITQASDPLQSELAPLNPSLISPLLSPALHGRPSRSRPLPWLSLHPHHPLHPLPLHLPPPRPRSLPTGPRRPHCPCLCPPMALCHNSKFTSIAGNCSVDCHMHSNTRRNAHFLQIG